MSKEHDNGSVNDVAQNVTLEMLLEVGKTLDRRYLLLTRDVSSSKQSALLFSNEQTTPQQFCQSLMEYVFSSILLTKKLSESNKNAAQILLNKFEATIPPNIDLVMAINKAYGNKTSTEQCDTSELAQALGRIGTEFLANRVEFEDVLANIGTSKNTAGPRAHL